MVAAEANGALAIGRRHAALAELHLPRCFTLIVPLLEHFKRGDPGVQRSLAEVADVVDMRVVECPACFQARCVTRAEPHQDQLGARPRWHAKRRVCTDLQEKNAGLSTT